MLKYTKFVMEQNLALTLVKCWVLRSRAFRLVDRLVPFSVFDVVLLTGLPTTGEMVLFEDDGTMIEIGEMVRKRVEEEELRRRKVGGRSRENWVYQSGVAAMVYLLERNAGEEQLELWLKLYAWLVLSGLLFPREVYGAVWELQRYGNDVHGMSCYAWVETVWHYIV